MTDWQTDSASGRAPLIKRAAKAIIQSPPPHFGEALQHALATLMPKPKSWEAQLYVIRALAAAQYTPAVPYLKMLIQADYRAAVLYRELAFAIVYLQNSSGEDLSFVYQSLQSGHAL